ncbi:hypothetical protein F4821DRAFT_274755 [Hypoxylon rubiginosum]|uniref:Uncharacterized protein n=1 Tax=Hypoxylon rubiginosum TaxID=110542 RepID=A0ACC0DDV5_9PEZI|nr:hypothetical protein F4821DRAFT_274755 [Hypoxylon rubiginosum]
MSQYDDPVPLVVPPPNQWADDMSLEEQQQQKQQEIDTVDDLLYSTKRSMDELKAKRQDLEYPTPPYEIEALYTSVQDLLGECDNVEELIHSVGGLPPNMVSFKNEADFEPLGVGPPLSHAPGLYEDMHRELQDLREDLEKLEKELQKMSEEAEEEEARRQEEEDEADATNSLFGDDQIESVPDETFDDILEDVPKGTKRTQNDKPDDSQDSKRAKLDVESDEDPPDYIPAFVPSAPLQKLKTWEELPPIWDGSNGHVHSSGNLPAHSPARPSVNPPAKRGDDDSHSTNLEIAYNDRYTGGGRVPAPNSPIDSDSDDKSHFSEESSDIPLSDSKEDKIPEPSVQAPVVFVLAPALSVRAAAPLNSEALRQGEPLRSIGPDDPRYYDALDRARREGRDRLSGVTRARKTRLRLQKHSGACAAGQSDSEDDWELPPIVYFPDGTRGIVQTNYYPGRRRNPPTDEELSRMGLRPIKHPK